MAAINLFYLYCLKTVMGAALSSNCLFFKINLSLYHTEQLNFGSVVLCCLVDFVRINISGIWLFVLDITLVGVVE